jgi:hypothetical protein
LLGTPRTDPGERDSRTGLPPWVTNKEAHKQLLVHDRASGTRSPGGAESGAVIGVGQLAIEACATRNDSFYSEVAGLKKKALTSCGFSIYPTKKFAGGAIYPAISK